MVFFGLLAFVGSIYFLLGMRDRAQARLGELLGTVWVGVLIVSILFAVVEIESEYHPYVIAIVFVLLFGGSAWAWSVARRSNEARRNRRALLLITG